MQMHVYVCMRILYEDLGFGHPYADGQVREATEIDNSALLQ